MQHSLLLKFQAWLIWSIVSFCVLYQFLLQTSVSVMIPAFMDAFHIDMVQVGILSSSYFYSYLTMQLPAGLLVDRFGHRVVLGIGLAITALGCLLFAHAQSLAMAVAARIIMGLGSSPIITASFSLVANWFPVRLFVLVIGITDAMGMLGAVVGQAYLSRWVLRLGWQDTILACGIIATVLALLSFLFVRNYPNHMKVQLGKSRPANLFFNLGEMLRLRQVWVAGLFAGLTWGVVVAFAGLWSVPFLQVLYNIDLTKAALVSSMVFFGIAFFTPFIGWYSGHFGHRRSIMFILTVLFLMAVSATLYIPGLPLWLMFGLLFLWGLCASTYILTFAFVRDAVPVHSRAAAMGFTNMLCIGIGSPVLQPLIGYFLKLSSAQHLDGVFKLTAIDFKLAFSVLPICLLCALITNLFIQEKHE